MKTQKQTKKYWKIPKPTDNLKLGIKYFLLGVAFMILMIFFIEIIIKMIILNMIEVLILLTKVFFNNLDNLYILFFGGMIFLFIGYKIYELILIVWIKAIKWIIGEWRK